ncbi:MAG: hypothetical protein GY861_03930 [bacterium]|nr:hypothetical protein [bacterium]
MARIRTIKPEFFTSESIIELEPLARLFFIALWCEADREGRLAWKPKTLKYRYLPADNVNIESIADSLIEQDLIILYTHDDDDYCQVTGFDKHQVVNNRERQSSITPFNDDACVTRERGEKAEGRKERNGKEGMERKGTCDYIPFEDFWNIWPKKTAKKDAEKAWKKAKVETEAWLLIEKHLTTAYLSTEVKFIPNPATYINGQRWNDEIAPINQQQAIEPGFIEQHMSRDWADNL